MVLRWAAKGRIRWVTEEKSRSDGWNATTVYYTPIPRVERITCRKFREVCQNLRFDEIRFVFWVKPSEALSGFP
ncbi:hypothetical protein GCM10023155_44130 [Bremerella cremea]